MSDMDDFKRTLEMQANIAQVKRMENGTDNDPITNTSKQHPAEHLLYAMSNGTEGLIEDMEAKGQQEMVKAAGSRLPAEGTGPDWRGECFDWSLWGVKIGKAIEGDEIWVEAELPKGWKIAATGHHMWSNLLDEKGRERASIFYKAASYDRSCAITPNCRYKSSIESTDIDDRNSPYFGLIIDGKEEIHRLGPFVDKKEEHNTYMTSAYSIADKAARAYLNENYPDNGKPEAYWD